MTSLWGWKEIFYHNPFPWDEQDEKIMQVGEAAKFRHDGRVRRPRHQRLQGVSASRRTIHTRRSRHHRSAVRHRRGSAIQEPRRIVYSERHRWAMPYDAKDDRTADHQRHKAHCWGSCSWDNNREQQCRQQIPSRSKALERESPSSPQRAEHPAPSRAFERSRRKVLWAFPLQTSKEPTACSRLSAKELSGTAPYRGVPSQSGSRFLSIDWSCGRIVCALFGWLARGGLSTTINKFITTILYKHV